tara:strand:+ start:624 stop:1526 length:903 start_codon:yes stop_codon:yes gene_type:complete
MHSQARRANPDSSFDYTLQTIYIHGCPVRAIVDTGSNISIMRRSLIQDLHAPARKDSAAKFTVDLSGIESRIILFDTRSCQAGEVTIIDATMRGANKKQQLPLCPFLATVLDLDEAVPHFPPHVDMILGTNALVGSIVAFGAKSGPRLLGAKEAITQRQQVSAGHPFVELVITACDRPGDQLGPLFVAHTDVGLFLLDTGNHMSAFCDTRLTDKCAPVLQTVGKSIDGGLKLTTVFAKRKTPPSMSVIGSWCETGMESPPPMVVGNVGASILSGDSRAAFAKTIFDFQQHRVFVCCPNLL